MVGQWKKQAEGKVWLKLVVSPAEAVDVAALLGRVTGTREYGVDQAKNGGGCAWVELSEEMYRVSGKQVKVHGIPTEQYPTKAIRPKNSRMSKACLDLAGFHRLPDWKDALARYWKELSQE